MKVCKRVGGGGAGKGGLKPGVWQRTFMNNLITPYIIDICLTSMSKLKSLASASAFSNCFLCSIRLNLVSGCTSARQRSRRVVIWETLKNTAKVICRARGKRGGTPNHNIFHRVSYLVCTFLKINTNLLLLISVCL